MELASLLLCDATTVREGLLHLLGGGITRIWREELPAPFGISAAALVSMDQAELDRPHEVQLRVIGPDGSTLVQMMAGFQPDRPPRLELNERVTFPVGIPFPQAGTNQWGKHRAELSIDGTIRGEADFWVLHVEELQLPDPT